MTHHHKIHYVELPTQDLEATKLFFQQVFNFEFVDYGPEYSAFEQAQHGIDGGFFKAEAVARTENGSALIVLYSDALEQTEAAVTAHGGVICMPTFSFPGGRRFHFIEPGGSELAVWTQAKP
ncbi:MAG: VOC family protein [Pseudomonadota bacterium]